MLVSCEAMVESHNRVQWFQFSQIVVVSWKTAWMVKKSQMITISYSGHSNKNRGKCHLCWCCWMRRKIHHNSWNCSPLCFVNCDRKSKIKWERFKHFSSSNRIENILSLVALFSAFLFWSWSTRCCDWDNNLVLVNAELLKLIQLKLPSVWNRLAIKRSINGNIHGKRNINFNYWSNRQCMFTLCNVLYTLEFFATWNWSKMQLCVV